MKKPHDICLDTKCPNYFFGIDDDLVIKLREFNKIETKERHRKNIAILIHGQTRDFLFPKIHDNIKKYIEILKKNKFDVVCFFYLNTNTPNFKGSTWHYDFLVGEGIVKTKDDAKKMVSKYFKKMETSEKYITELILSKFGHNSVIKFYDEYYIDNILENMISKEEKSWSGKVSRKNAVVSQRIQWELLNECNKMLKNYETENNTYFGKIIRTRPDIIIPNEFFNSKVQKSFSEDLSKYDSILYASDFIKILPRYIFNFILSLDFPNFHTDKFLVELGKQINESFVYHHWYLFKTYFAKFYDISHLSGFEMYNVSTCNDLFLKNIRDVRDE